MKKIIHKIISVICSAAVLAISTALPVNRPVYAESAPSSQSGETVYINDIEDFLKLAEDCRMDSASKKLNVMLTTDISLSGNEFFGIPIFCGTFDGNGHTISGISIQDSASEIGLFRHVERGAVIKNLTVTGTVSPSGSRNMVGGIAGVNRGTITYCKFSGNVSGNNAIGGIAGKNEETGVIKGCESSATIAAESSAGGIVGTNLGIIIDCSNSGSINTVYADAEINADELDLDNMSANVIRKSDIGGIAGYSSGTIQRCSNSGTVGYQHTGYNIGGIVGRQNGMVSSCKNTGSIFGRKDVGGIAGQMEPYRSIEFSQDAVQQLGAEMDILSESVDKLISDAGDGGSRINSEFQTLTSQMNAAQKNAEEIANRTESVLGGLANELLPRTDTALEVTTDGLNLFDAAIKSLEDFSDKCAQVLSEMEQEGVPVSDSAVEALNDLNKALSGLESGFQNISNALGALQKSLGDPEQMNDSLVEIKNSLDDITDSMKDASDAANQLNTVLGEMSDWPDGSDWQKLKNSVTALSDCLAEVLSALGDMSDAVGDISAAIDSDGLDEMNKALSELNTASASLGDAAANFALAMSGVDISDTELQSAAGDASEALLQMSDLLDQAAKQIETVTNTLTGKSESRFPALDSLFTSAADDLSENMKAMISTLSRIDSIANSEGNELLDDVQRVNDCLNRISGIFRDTYRDLLSNEDQEWVLSDDISESESENSSDPADILHGKALGCSNSGIVEGDVNVGGITGSMAIEVDLDPEDDITLNGDRSINFSYNVMDIIENCENSGRITAKKNYCGGIVGKMDMGLVKNSLSSGTVSADSGSYVGGIAGYSSAKLRGCFSKVTLSGMSYIGGIAGEGGIITDCLSISDITGFSEKIGAVAGYVDFSKKNTETLRNFFVDRGVAGIDRVSYAGIAEPMSYSQFAELTGDFADILVEFTVEGETLAKLKIPYGGSLKASDIPEIPQKSGYYARWEDFDFENITFPCVLEAEYIQLLTLVGSDKKSEQGLPLVLADGNFDDTASVTIETESSSILAPEGSELRIITIKSGSAPTALRFLKTGDNPKLMQYINGDWKAIPFTENGSYLIIKDPSLENETAAFCISGSAVNTAMIVTTAIIAAVVILTVTVILILIKKNKSKKQKQHS